MLDGFPNSTAKHFRKVVLPIVSSPLPFLFTQPFSMALAIASNSLTRCLFLYRG